MKIKSHVIRNGARNWQNEAETLRGDDAMLSGHRQIVNKEAGTTGPQTAASPQSDPAAIVTLGGPVFSASPRFALSSGSFTQNWSNSGLITTNDDWSGVPAIVGYRGDNVTSVVGVDARTLTANDAAPTVDVNANQTDPIAFITGGVTEFDLADDTIALAGSGTADAPYIVIYLDSTGRENVRFQCNLRDLDASTDDAAQQINIQYRTNPTGSWTNVTGGYFADVTTAGTATQVTAVDVTLPADAANSSTLEIRIMSVNATGNDEWVGVDDIIVSSSAISASPGSLSINDVSHAEGDAGATTYTFTVTRSGGSSGAITADYTIAAPGGAGNADSADFVPASVFSGQVSFADGETSKTITIDVQGDDLVETDETFTVTLSNATGGATIGDATGVGTITNDDQYGTLAINDVSMAEGDSGTTNFVFTVTRSSGDDGAISADYTINLPGGVGGADATDIPGTLTGTVNFADGETSKTITVGVSGDTTFEPNESFTVTLSNPQGGTSITDATGAGTITNDDPAPAGTFSIDDVSHAEGDSGATTYTFTVTRTGGSAGPVTADWVISAPGGAGNADSGDFVGGSIFSGQVSFADGETSKTITIDVQGDTSFEATETFTVTLSNATGGAGIGDGVGVGTITNDDIAVPSVSIGDAAIVEGNTGISYLVFTVSLSNSSASTVTVNFATSNGTATAGLDYVAHSGQVSFAPGQTSQTVSIPIIGDTNPETNETFTVTLTAPANATLGDDTATGTITNDDGSAYYSLAGGSFTQNWTNTGLITASDNWSGVPFIVGFRGDDLTTATATDARTITTTSAVVDVNANQTNPNTNTSGGVTEFDGIANPVVALQGSGTADAPYLALYMDATGRSDIRVQANLRDIDGSTDDAAQQIAVQYRTSPTGPWLNAPGGYFSDVTTGGAATQVTAVDITLPADANGVATLEIRFLTTNAAGNDEWVGIDDIVVSSQVSAPILSIADTAAFEGNAGTTPITFTVTRQGDSTGAVSATWTASLGSGPFDAQAGDFAAGQVFTGTVSFASGETSQTITLNIQGDVNPEGNDAFTVTLSNPVGGTIADATATGTIINDDGQPPLVTINDVTVSEGNSGTSLMTFTVTRTGGTGAFDVDFHTANGSGIEPGDYLANSGTLHFAAGQMTDTISITINGDTDSETSETLQVILDNPTNFALITDGLGIGTIAGDDPIYIHDIQGTSYYSPILAAEGISGFNIASAGFVTVRAIVTAVDNVGTRQGYYLSEEITDWDGNSYTSEGIFVMTRNDANVGTVVSGVSVGDLVQISAQVMEYQSFNTMPRTVLVNSTGLQVISTGNALPVVTLTNMPNAVLTAVTPDYTDSSDGAGDTFDASVYALSYFETVEGMLVTIPNMVVADGFVSTSGGDPFLQAYSLDSANPGQINSRGGYTVAGDPPIGPPDTATTGDDTNHGGQHLHDGDVNPDIIELDFTDFAMSPPAGLTAGASMGDQLGDITGIIDFDFTDRKLFVTGMEPGGFVDGSVTQETTTFGNDGRSLTVGAFNVENLDPGDGAARFTAIANAIANNLHAPDIISIEEMQDNNGATNDGTVDASTTWQMLVDALNLATGAHYQWVDQNPVNGTEGGEPGGNIRVGFLYNTDRVQLGDLAANATIAERRQYTDRIGDGVRDAGDLIAYDDSMVAAEISTGDWSSTRRSLLAEFTFHGNTVYVTANHLTAKGGSGEFWQFDQNLETGDPANAGWAKRSEQAEDVYSMLNLISSSNPNAGIVSGGDYNDFYFYRPLTTLTGYTMADGTARVGGVRLDNLTLTLSEAERYTYTFDGRSQAIDHIIANSLLANVANYDVVHLNTGFNPTGTPALSDHDPGLATFDYRSFGELLIGTSIGETIDGFGGNDVIIGNGGTDIMIGGTGNDVFRADSSGDIVQEAVGGGFDAVYVGAAGYSLAAGQEIELLSYINPSEAAGVFLNGNEFAQTIIGSAGNDGIDGGGGDDIMVGGAGNDGYRVQQAGDVVLEFAGGGTDTVYVDNALGSYTLQAGYEIENLAAYSSLSTVGLTLTGNGIANFIMGSAGADTLIGGGGNDTLQGLGGNDTYRIDDLGDVIVESSSGGGTMDRAYVAMNLSGYTLDQQSAVELLSAIDTSSTQAFNLTGNLLAQTIIGTAGANVLIGGGGADVLAGLGGNDIYRVEDANAVVLESAGGGFDAIYVALSVSSYTLRADAEIELVSAIDPSANVAMNLTGNDFGNTLVGTAGANVLNGGAGEDGLFGGGGADTFAFTARPQDGNDTILDFAHGVDKIALDDAAYTTIGGPGALNANSFVLGTAAGDADDRIIYDAATGHVFYDADGTGAGAAVLFATLTGTPTLTASDFVVI